jgi:hypothetical protein
VELRHIEQVNSPGRENHVRLTAEISYDHRFLKPESYWFEVTEKYAAHFTDSGNPWLACLIPLAVTIGESLRIDRPVDRELYNNVHELMDIWVGWYPYLHIVPIETEVVDATHRTATRRTATFFSGGVDSFHTVLHYNAAVHTTEELFIDDLLLIWGLDIPLKGYKPFQRVVDNLQRAAEDLEKELVIVATNLRETQFQRTDYSQLAHASALAGAGLAMEERYETLIIPSSASYKKLHPWGSHPQTDPLHSTGQTRVVHYGHMFERLEKTALVAESDIALRSLRVCWSSDSGGNCGICNKCLRTMASLALYNALERCPAFPESALDLDRLATLYSARVFDARYLRDIQLTARKTGRVDIADAIESSFQYTDRINRRLFLSLVWKARAWLQTKPALWHNLRWGRRLFAKVVRKFVGS